MAYDVCFMHPLSVLCKRFCWQKIWTLVNPESDLIDHRLLINSLARVNK